MKRFVLPLAVVAVIGAGVAIAIPVSGGPFRAADPTPTMTADQVSELSDRLNREDMAANAKIANDFITSGASVAKLRKSEAAGLRLDQPLALDAALEFSSAVLSGKVEDQLLGRLPGQGSRLFIVSILLDESGSEVGRLYQQTAITRGSQGVTLLFGYGNEGLVVGRRYAAPCVGDVQACVAQYGHLYEVDAATGVEPFAEFEGRDLIEGRSVAFLLDRWASIHADP